LGQYVKTEKHLPNIPNAGEIQDKGVNLGEFQMKLLEKIEELTLYAVEQAKVIDRQSEQIREEQEANLKERGVNEEQQKAIRDQQAELTDLKAKLARLEALLRGR